MQSFSESLQDRTETVGGGVNSGVVVLSLLQGNCYRGSILNFC